MSEFFKGDSRKDEGHHRSPKSKLLMPILPPHQERAQPTHSPRNVSFSKAERDTNFSLGILKVDNRQVTADDALHASDNEVDPAEVQKRQRQQEELLEARRRRYGPKCVFGKAERDTNPSMPRWYRDSVDYDTAHLWSMGSVSARRRATSPSGRRSVSPSHSRGRSSPPSRVPSPPSTANGAPPASLSRRQRQKLYAKGGLSIRTSLQRMAELNGKFTLHHPSQSRLYALQLRQGSPAVTTPRAATRAIVPAPPPLAISRTRSPPQVIKLKTDANGANIAGSESKPQLPLGFGSRADRFGEKEEADSTPMLDVKYDSVERHVQGPRLKAQAPRPSQVSSRDGYKVVGPGRALSSSFGSTRPIVQTVRGFYNTRI